MTALEPWQMAGKRVTRTVNSALWASWADATGFISELTDERGLRRRLRNRELIGPVAWPRRLGGKFGPTVTLPAGTYSDDTQLRLATCRAIGPNGFDVDAFARVELPVWSAYALGGGRASKSAAQAMSKANAVWYANEYPGWRESGGNGAVMRVQPHAWAEAAPDRPGPWMADVIANAVCSHAHPRALLASAIHCYGLGRVLTTGRVPGPDDWPQLLALAAAVPDLMSHRAELVDYWIPRYDEQAQHAGEDRFGSRWEQTVAEIERQMLRLAPLTRELAAAVQKTSESEVAYVSSEVHASYEAIIGLLQLREPERRGSATGTALAALAVAWSLGDRPTAAVLLTCRAIDTDTDTIATMVGALVGAAAPHPPATSAEGVTQDDAALVTSDVGYQTSQARRCTALALGTESHHSFLYPDLLAWAPPKTQLDAVGLDGDRRVLLGLGFAEAVAAADIDQRGQLWQWHLLDFGQHVLLKMRPEPRQGLRGQLPVRRCPDADVALVDATEVPERGGLDVKKGQATGHPTQSKFDRRREEQRKRNALAHLGGGERDPDPQLLLDVPTSLTDHPLDAAPVREETSLPPDIEGMLNWVSNKNFDDRSVAFFMRRLADEVSLEQYLIAVRLLRERLRARRTGCPPSR